MCKFYNSSAFLVGTWEALHPARQREGRCTYRMHGKMLRWYHLQICSPRQQTSLELYVFQIKIQSIFFFFFCKHYKHFTELHRRAWQTLRAAHTQACLLGTLLQECSAWIWPAFHIIQTVEYQFWKQNSPNMLVWKKKQKQSWICLKLGKRD